MLQKNYILLILPIKEISLQPELSSPARFRFQGGYPERDGGGGVRMEILVSNIGCRDCPEGRLRSEGGSLTQDQPGPDPGPAYMT